MPTHHSRSSGPTSPNPGADDINNLNLDAVRARLERNSRVLGSGIFSPSPTTADDPVRQKLLEAREQLLAREQELLALGVEGMNIEPGSIPESSSAARRRSSTGVGGSGELGGARSGKASALEAIQANESRLAKNGLLIPLSETVALGQRDYYDAAAQRLSELSLAQSSPTPAKSKRHPERPDQTDEIARAQATARMRAFMSYKDEEDDGEGEDNGLIDADWEGEYDGDGDRLEFAGEAGGGGGGGEWREKGTGEEVDELGEDDERWPEGSEEYLDRAR
ncbi:hypothetical protein BCR39DRAFT_505425 [Naematelia encephala]|uniref:Uncharacterized protein n=1 Tax=Naematelia encephala TaxID=71784 RepID=A0A1Y2B4I8_9TREE|nr:hypothetical protein BCR39DRAFT_505425 [Naematelia encephala]